MIARALNILRIRDRTFTMPRAHQPQLLVHARGRCALAVDSDEHVRAAAVVRPVGLDADPSILARFLFIGGEAPKRNTYAAYLSRLTIDACFAQAPRRKPPAVAAVCGAVAYTGAHPAAYACVRLICAGGICTDCANLNCVFVTDAFGGTFSFFCALSEAPADDRGAVDHGHALCPDALVPDTGVPGIAAAAVVVRLAAEAHVEDALTVSRANNAVCVLAGPRVAGREGS